MASFKLKDKNGVETTYTKSGIKIPNASGTGYAEFSTLISVASQSDLPSTAPDGTIAIIREN